ncbi:MAG: proteasome accessory factor [Actinomycetota bacterium]|nr:proteasome accessory factor [Actinomycetota bacterium]
MSAGNGYTPYVLRVCEALQQHGNQLPIGDLARAVGATVANLRAELEAYADLDESPSLNPLGGAFLFVMPAAEEVGLGAEAAGAGDGAGADARAASGDDDVPRASDADVVHLAGSPEDFLGVERFDATVLGPLYTAAEDLLVQEPDNAALASAATKLREEFLPGVAPRRHYHAPVVAALARVIRERRRVRIVYSRTWESGMGERVIEPHRLVRTRRGYEVDAGPIDASGALRTFLVGRIRQIEVLGDTFDWPSGASELSRRSRATVTVSGFVPHSGRWAINKYAEAVRWEEGKVGEQEAWFEAQVLPPVHRRVSLMVISAGPGTVLDQAEYDAAIHDMAQELANHHRLDEM